MISIIISSAVIKFLSVTLLIWSIISMWVIFEKAGKKGWQALIPIRNIFVLFKIIGKKIWFYFLILPFIILLLSLFFRILSFYNLGHRNTNGFNTIAALLNFLYPFALILFLVFLILTGLRVAKKFGKSAGFGLGLVFLMPIFLGILAFDDSRFEGVEFNKKYNWKKLILIAILIGLIIGCCNAYLKYRLYNPIFSEYEYRIGKKNGEVKTTTFDGKKGGGVYENGKKVGYWVEYNLGAKWEGNYNIEGEREGEWKITTEDGKQGGGMYKNGKEIGSRIIYWNDGKKFIGRYDDDGLKQGEWKSYYENGNLFEIGNYEDGKKIGEWTYYRQDGTSTKLIFMEGKAWEGTEITSWGSENEYTNGNRVLYIKAAE